MHSTIRGSIREGGGREVGKEGEGEREEGTCNIKVGTSKKKTKPKKCEQNCSLERDMNVQAQYILEWGKMVFLRIQ